MFAAGKRTRQNFGQLSRTLGCMNQHGGFMRRVFGSVTTAAALAGLLSTALPAAAATVSIDLSTQRMHVEGAGGARYDWPISSAREAVRAGA